MTVPRTLFYCQASITGFGGKEYQWITKLLFQLMMLCLYTIFGPEIL